MVFPIRNQQPAIGNVVISPSPLSSPQWVEEILIINCHLPIVFFGRPHRVAPINNLISRSLAHFSLSCSLVIPVQTGIQFLFFSTDNQQPAIDNVVIRPHLCPLPAG